MFGATIELIQDWMCNPKGSILTVNYTDAQRLVRQEVAKIKTLPKKNPTKLVKVRFVEDWMGFKKGHEGSLLNIKAEELQGRKVLKIIEEKDNKTEQIIEEKAIDQAPVNKMVQEPNKKKSFTNTGFMRGGN